jgi:predicted nucleic acid-binding protein
MRFWDASAIVPLLVEESLSARADELLAEDHAIVTWWGTLIECHSALSRLHREGLLDLAGTQAATARLQRLASRWIEVPAVAPVREQAVRLLRIHLLRAGDAVQLAAALVAAEFRANTLEFVTFDSRQASAADLEGFRVLAGGSA